MAASGRLPLRLRELAALTIALVATSYLAFDTQSVGMGFAEPLFYAPVPLLFWSAIRFGKVGATGAVGILAAFAILADIARDDRRADAVIGRVRGLFRKQEIQMQPLDLNEAVADDAA